jgi:hypothetical protein
MPDFPSDPLDAAYERGIRVAHDLEGDRGSLIRFLGGLVSELSQRNEITEPKQLRAIHDALLVLVSNSFRQAAFRDIEASAVKSQLGSVLTRAHEDLIRRRQSGPPRPAK